jgi:predicted molibdopterin-dependent oxidoreductase YjgC
VSWNEAFDLIAEKMQSSQPDRIGMLISPNLCNEDLYIAQKFMRVVLASHNIDSSSRLFYGSGFNAYLGLMEHSVPLSTIQQASAILLVGLDTRFSRSVVGVALRTAMKNGSSIFSLNAKEHRFSLKADVWLRPKLGEEFRFVAHLARLTSGQELSDEGIPHTQQEKLREVARGLADSSNTVILIGSDLLHNDSNAALLQSVAVLARNTGAGVMPLPAQNNLYGSLLAGTYPEILPGMRSSGDSTQLCLLEDLWNSPLANLTDTWNATMLCSDLSKLQLLYAVGDVPMTTSTAADFVVFQNMYPPEPYCSADLVLPSAAATEVDGSFMNGEKRLQRVRRAVTPLGNALPDWEIICRLARAMGSKEFAFSRPEEIREEMSRAIPEFTEEHLDSRVPVSISSDAKLRIPSNGDAEPGATDARFPFLFHATCVENTHRGFPLSAWVEGARMLFPEDTLEVSAEDAGELQLANGDSVLVRGASFEKSFPVRIVKTQPRGTLHASLLETITTHPNPQPVSVRKADV